MKLKYGMNPNQDYAEIIDNAGALTILNGNPSVINVLDALNSWQLVKEASECLNIEAAASFKHVTPSGVAISKQLSNREKTVNLVNLPVSSLAAAYIRARGVDRLASFGDFIALSHKVDSATSNIIKTEVSDGIIAPDYSMDALEILKSKKKGNFVIFQIDRRYQPEDIESRDVFGITLKQKRNTLKIGNEHINKIVTQSSHLSPDLISDIKLGMITLKYTQSNSICIVNNGQVIGIGSGQQSRILCANLALSKANIWYQKQKLDYSTIDTQNFKRAELDQMIEKQRNDMYGGHNVLKELSGTCLVSDGYFPQSDTIDLANEYGVEVIASPMGSIRDREIIANADKYGITFIDTGVRLFHH